MALSHVELYEALRGHVGDDAARMIADVVPPARDLATRTDIAGIKIEIAELRAEMKSDFASLERRITGRMWAMFVPQWAFLFGMLLTLWVRGF